MVDFWKRLKVKARSKPIKLMMVSNQRFLSLMNKCTNGAHSTINTAMKNLLNYYCTLEMSIAFVTEIKKFLSSKDFFQEDVLGFWFLFVASKLDEISHQRPFWNNLRWMIVPSNRMILIVNQYQMFCYEHKRSLLMKYFSESLAFHRKFGKIFSGFGASQFNHFWGSFWISFDHLLVKELYRLWFWMKSKRYWSITFFVCR